MGWPALIGLALSAAGTGVESYANAQTQKNENATINDNLTNQKALQAKATGIFNQNLNSGNSAPQATAAINTAAQQNQQQYAALAKQPSINGASPVDVNPVVQARTDASTQNIGNAGAKLQGYSQWGVNQAIQNMLAGQQIGLVGNQSQQLQQTLGPQLQQAAGSEAGLSGLGSLLGTLGTAVGVGGSVLGGAGAGAAGAGTSLSKVPFGTIAANQARPFSLANGPYGYLGGY